MLKPEFCTRLAPWIELAANLLPNTISARECSRVFKNISWDFETCFMHLLLPVEYCGSLQGSLGTSVLKNANATARLPALDQ